MRRFAARGIIIVLLLLSAGYLIKTAGTDCLFAIRNFIGIAAGEVEPPVIKKTTLVCIFVVPSLLGLLIGTIPRKDGTYIDEECENERK